MADYTSARKAMVDNQIATSSVTDPRLLSAFSRVPRELFVPAERRALAYSDAHHPLGNRRFLPAPAVFARLVQLADIAESDRVLDFWPATGYSTAILAGLASEVVAVEPDSALAHALAANLDSLGLTNASLAEGGLQALNFNHFDTIVVEGAMERVPEALFDLLSMGGRLVCLLRHGPVGIATVYTRMPEGVVTRTWFNATLPAIEPEPPSETFVF
jgi:protein-L-isoaspartate(D-aspartate) O-methyltransferase